MATFIEQFNKRSKAKEKLPSTTAELEKNICEFYLGELTQKEIADLYCISQGYVCRILKKHNIPIREPPNYANRQPKRRT